MTSWSTASDLEAKLRRQWASGALLRAHALGEAFVPVELPLRGPTSGELADRLDEARRWAAALGRASDEGRAFSVSQKAVGGRHLGRTEIPGRAVVDSYGQAWQLLGVGGPAGEVASFDAVIAASAHVPAARAWALAHPVRAASLVHEWTAILAARDWLDWNRDSGLFLRQVDAPGVDTKLIERHRPMLAAMLGVSSSVAGFTEELGFASKPVLVRMRFDPALFGMPAGVTEAQLRLEELRDIDVTIEHALIVENEISYLSVPVPRGGVVLYGKGYDAGNPASLAWLQPASAAGHVRYWGDLDTHGFQILHRVRAHLPGVRSVLMDRETLLAHETRWGSEPTPTNAALLNLSDTETALYSDLITDRYAHSLRLEQERIDWSWVKKQLGEP